MSEVKQADYVSEMLTWRETKETQLRAEDGWLTVVGLEWLEDGENTVGGAATCDVTLPNEDIPAQVGTLYLENGRVTLHVTTTEPVYVDGVAVTSAVVRDETQPDQYPLVTLRTVTFFIIKRGDRYAVRIRDTNSVARQNFDGRYWFPVNEAYRVVAQFVPHAQQSTLEVETTIGTVTSMENPGLLEFEVNGQTVKLEAFKDGDDGDTPQLWLIFRDATSGKQTYGASRFLKTPFLPDGRVLVDFNQAYHPPCAFTDYATCPLPPAANRLSIAIEAGEKLAD